MPICRGVNRRLRTAVVSGENGDHKDTTMGAKRLGLHRTLCGSATDRVHRPPFRALATKTNPDKVKLPSLQTSKLSPVLLFYGHAAGEPRLDCALRKQVVWLKLGTFHT